MAGKVLMLSSRAKNDLNAIVRFFYHRNGNNEYGRKLRAKFFEAVRQIKQNEEAGQVFATTFDFWSLRSIISCFTKLGRNTMR